MIWPTTFFFSRTFCPTFGINWTERIYSLTNLLLLWFICIRFIFCLKKVLLDYSIQVLDQEPRKIYREYTELTKPCLNLKFAGRLGHPWFSSTPTGGSQEGSTQNEDWEWDLIDWLAASFSPWPQFPRSRSRSHCDLGCAPEALVIPWSGLTVFRQLTSKIWM